MTGNNRLPDISPASRANLLDLAFSRVNYGFGAMIVVAIPFVAWYAHLGHDPTALVLWVIWYGVAAMAVRWLYRRRYQPERARGNHEATLLHWLPIVHGIALVYGSSLAVLPVVTGHHATFEFHVLYLLTVAAIVSGHSVQSSPVLSVFRYVFISGWGGVTLLVPYMFPEHWHYVMPLCVLHILTMTKHSAVSHRFFVEKIALQEEAERALNDKNRFLTTASHDLRQPVHAMGFLVESIAYRNQDEALVPALDDLRRSVRSLNLMFNSLLDLTKIESGAVAIHPATVEIDNQLEEVGTLFREEARSRGLELRIRATRGGTVLADPLLLRQALVNLTQNALRYTSKGGVLLCARRRGNQWRFEVWDTGMGVASQDKGKIFSPFYRNEYAWRVDNAGHGLGLSVVARCAELMGASYGFNSIEGHGSWFWLQLPAGEPGYRLHTSPEVSATPSTRPIGGRCLVVEDDPLASAAWHSLMTAWRIDVRCVASGVEAMAVLDAGFMPQAILCDQRLRSGESGFDVLRGLLARVPDAAGAMVSGEYSAPELAQAEDEGYLVLHKPVAAADLHTILSLWLRRRAAAEPSPTAATTI
jgi:signal transduction histidine kinase/CheY-like chemotaxis protein